MAQRVITAMCPETLTPVTVAKAGIQGHRKADFHRRSNDDQNER